MNPLIVSALIGAGASAVSNTASNVANSRNTARANQLQRDLQRSTMMYNMTEADKARQFDSLGSRVRQLQSQGFNPELAVDMSSSSPSASASTPSVHQNPPHVPIIDSASVSNVLNAVNEVANRKYNEELQRAQVLATLAKGDLDAETKKKIDAEILDIYDNMSDRRINRLDSHILNESNIRLINAQIEDMKEKRKLAQSELEHKKADDAEKNRIAEKVGTFNDKIKTFEYVRDLISDFFDGSVSAQGVIDKVVEAPQSVFDYFVNVYGGLKKFFDSFSPGGSRHLDWSKYGRRSKVDRVHK